VNSIEPEAMKEEIVHTTSPAPSLSEVGPQSAPGANATGGAAAVLENVNARIGRYRWTICGLLFFAATINYIDRQVIGILKPTLKAELGWDEIAYSNIVFWFQAAYALGFIFMGRLMDRFGTRKGF
jgi:ACS family hexuronate transporter-like MFS transporter